MGILFYRMFFNDNTNSSSSSSSSTGADLEDGVGPRCPPAPPPPLKFEKCPIYLGCLGVFLQIYLIVFIIVMVPF